MPHLAVLFATYAGKNYKDTGQDLKANDGFVHFPGQMRQRCHDDLIQHADMIILCDRANSAEPFSIHFVQSVSKLQDRTTDEPSIWLLQKLVTFKIKAEDSTYHPVNPEETFCWKRKAWNDISSIISIPIDRPKDFGRSGMFRITI